MPTVVDKAKEIVRDIRWNEALVNFLNELTGLVKDFREKLKEENKNAKSR